MESGIWYAERLNDGMQRIFDKKCAGEGGDGAANLPQRGRSLRGPLVKEPSAEDPIELMTGLTATLVGDKSTFALVLMERT